MYECVRIAFSSVCMIAAMAVASSSAFAQSSASPIQSDFTVQVNVEKGCSATPPADFDFGQQNQTPWTAKRQTNTMTVTCTSGTAFDLTFSSLNDGVQGIQRFMVSPSSSSRILYYIRKDSYFAPTVGGVNVNNSLGDITAPVGNRISDVGDGSPKRYPLYLIIDQTSWTRSGNVPSPGMYSDRVTVQVTF